MFSPFHIDALRSLISATKTCHQLMFVNMLSYFTFNKGYIYAFLFAYKVGSISISFAVRSWIDRPPIEDVRDFLISLAQQLFKRNPNGFGVILWPSTKYGYKENGTLHPRTGTEKDKNCPIGPENVCYRLMALQGVIYIDHLKKDEKLTEIIGMVWRRICGIRLLYSGKKKVLFHHDNVPTNTSSVAMTNWSRFDPLRPLFFLSISYSNNFICRVRIGLPSYVRVLHQL